LRDVRRAALMVLAAFVATTASAQIGSAAASAPSSPAKKALVQRVLAMQQGDIEASAREIVQRPALQMMRGAELALQQQQAAPEKREATQRAIQTEVRKYVDDAYPVVRERALKLAPSTIGAALEAKMSEDELRALVAWLDSPANKKYQQVAAESRNDFLQQIRTEAGPLVQPKLVALDGRIRVILGVGPASGAAPQPVAPPRPTSR